MVHGYMDYGWLQCHHDTPVVEGIMDKSQMKVTVFDLGQVQRKFWGFDMLWGLPEWTFLKSVHCEVWTMDLWQSTLDSIVFFFNKKSVCQALLQGQAASADVFGLSTFEIDGVEKWPCVWMRLRGWYTMYTPEKLVDYPWKIGLFEQLSLFLRHLGCQIDTNDIKDLGKVVLEKGQQGVGGISLKGSGCEICWMETVSKAEPKQQQKSLPKLLGSIKSTESTIINSPPAAFLPWCKWKLQGLKSWRSGGTLRFKDWWLKGDLLGSRCVCEKKHQLMRLMPGCPRLYKATIIWPFIDPWLVLFLPWSCSQDSMGSGLSEPVS